MLKKPTYKELENRVLELEKVVSEHKHTDEKSLQNEIKFRDFVKTTTDLVWSVDLNGNHTFCNKMVESILGYQVEEVINFSAFPQIHADDQPWARTMLIESTKFKKGWANVPIRWIHKDGSIRYTESSAQPIFDTKGNVKGFLGIDRDITKRKQVEKERKKLIDELQDALAEIKTLSGLLPICSSCKKIRDDQGYWNILESYIQKNSDAHFTHSICPECSDKLYGKENWYIKAKKDKG
jgi:PAS domain S-box-containing protein